VVSSNIVEEIAVLWAHENTQVERHIGRSHGNFSGKLRGVSLREGGVRVIVMILYGAVALMTYWT
jgi:hypothetical protein